MKVLVVLFLLALVGCGERRDPWGRRLTEAERAEWGRSCGSVYKQFATDDHVSHSYRQPAGERTLSSCDMTWDRKNDRLFDVNATLGVDISQTTPPTAEQIEPYVRLIEPLLPSDERRIAREIAFGHKQTVKTKNFTITGGHGIGTDGSSPTLWRLHVVVR